MKKYLFFAIILVLLAACSSSDEKKETAEAPKLTATEAAVIADNEDWMLSQIAMFNLDSQGNILFLDRQQHKVFYLDPDGNEIQIFGREGSGPGEFNMAFSAIMFDDDRIVIPDMMQRRMSEFHLKNGEWEFAKEFVIADNPMGFVATAYNLQNGTFLISNPFRMNTMPEADKLQNRPTTYHLMQADGTILEEDYLELKGAATIFSQVGGGFNFAAIPYHESEVFTVSPAGDRYLSNNMEINIERFTAEGELVQTYTWDYERLPVTEEDLEIHLRNHEGDFRNLVRGFIPDMKPAISQVLVSDTNEVWVQLHAKHGETKWLVFNEDGSIKGQVEFPERTGLQHIRGNKVYTINQNEFDVPVIKIFEIS